jgi:hypothetical protein
MLKRAIPFILTFAFGLIIASFFVNIMPSFEFKRGGRHHRKHQFEELQRENDRLRQENDRLKMEKTDTEDFDFHIDAPMPPPPPATVPRNR